MDSRTVKAVLRELAESPRPIAEVDFDPKTGTLTRIVFAPTARPVVAPPQPESGKLPERNETPRIAKTRKSAVASLKLAPPEWQPEPEASANA